MLEDACGELGTGKQGRLTDGLLTAEERARVTGERRASFEELAKAMSGQVIAPTELQHVAALDKTVLEARAVVSAGAVRVAIISFDGTPVRLGGEGQTVRPIASWAPRSCSTTNCGST